MQPTWQPFFMFFQIMLVASLLSAFHHLSYKPCPKFLSQNEAWLHAAQEFKFSLAYQNTKTVALKKFS
jgi:hypothetical protein